MDKPEDNTAAFLRARLDYHTVRGRMLTDHLVWLESLVSLAMAHLPPRARRDEALSEAVDEMFDLLDRWDPGRASFKHFAGRRVLGRIADWARRKRIVESKFFSLDALLGQSPD
jgi:DNA-directed RNA polymerase specialized sigma subunit